MANFERVQRIFEKIKNNIEAKDSKELVKEFEKAVNKLLSEYDTNIWENRFTLGGALEILFCALLNSLKFKTKLLKEARYDIEIEGVKFSLKSNFTGSGDIRLINILGEKKAVWKEPTIFFIG